MTVQPHTTPGPSQRQPLHSVPSSKPKGKTAWIDAFTQVHPDALAALSPVQFKALVVLVRMTTDTGDGFIDPFRVCRMVGIGLVKNPDGKGTLVYPDGSVRVKSTITLRRWLGPGGALSPFVRLRGDTADHSYMTWNSKDEERWRLDYEDLPTFCRFPRRAGDDNKEGLTLFVKVPRNWLWEDPATTDGDHWVARGVSDEALWAGAVCVKEAQGREGFRRGIAATEDQDHPTGTYLAEDYHLGKSAMKKRLAEAEDAGFVRVTGRGGNRRAAYRMPQLKVSKDVTTKSRARQPRTDRYVPPVLEMVIDEEPPF